MRLKHVRLIGSIGAGAALFSAITIASAEASPSALQVGDTYEITMTRHSVQQGSQGSSGSSDDRDTIVERVIGLRPDGVELEYDLPKTAKADKRTSNWQFPARVFKPFHGSPELLNSPELEARVSGWLTSAGLTRAACGHWIFTWNAFRIECDPQSVIKTVEAFDVSTTDLREGASYQDAAARDPGTLIKTASAPDGTTFTVEMPVDPNTVRRARAESDVVVGEIMHKPVTLETALGERAKETITGTISATFETDSAGNLRRKTRVTKQEIKAADGQSETQTVTETLERRLVSRRR